MMLIRLLIFATLVLIASCASHPQGEFIRYYEAKTDKPYDDVLAELEVAIAEHNFRITGHSRVGKVIRDRGTPDFPDYDTIQFCNLTHAKTLLQMSPHAVRHMPCNVVVYQFEGKTIIKTHLMPTDTQHQELNAFSEKMNETLMKIVDFAAEQ